MREKRIQVEPNPISQEELRVAIDRINQGAVGENIENSNLEILKARKTIDQYINYFGTTEEGKSQEEKINKALGIGEFEVSTSFNFIDGVIGNGTRKTGNIAPSSFGTGLSRQEKTPRFRKNN